MSQLARTPPWRLVLGHVSGLLLLFIYFYCHIIEPIAKHERPPCMLLPAFHNGDVRHNEFSIHVKGEVGWMVSEL